MSRITITVWSVGLYMCMYYATGMSSTEPLLQCFQIHRAVIEIERHPINSFHNQSLQFFLTFILQLCNPVTGPSISAQGYLIAPTNLNFQIFDCWPAEQSDEFHEKFV